MEIIERKTTLIAIREKEQADDVADPAAKEKIREIVEQWIER